MKYLLDLARRGGVTPAQLDQEVQGRFGVESVYQLPSKSASSFIDELGQVKYELKILKEKEDGLKELISFEMGKATSVESDSYRVEKRPKFTYCWDDSIIKFLYLT